jgi:ketopantoate reductase
MDRKELAMKHRRSFATDLKRQVIEELLSGVTAYLCRAAKKSGVPTPLQDDVYSKLIKG